MRRRSVFWQLACITTWMAMDPSMPFADMTKRLLVWQWVIRGVRCMVDANGIHLMDGTKLLGLGGLSIGFVLDSA